LLQLAVKTRAALGWPDSSDLRGSAVAGKTAKSHGKQREIARKYSKSQENTRNRTKILEIAREKWEIARKYSKSHGKKWEIARKKLEIGRKCEITKCAQIVGKKKLIKYKFRYFPKANGNFTPDISVNLVVSG
jgi:hypothetical protein